MNAEAEHSLWAWVNTENPARPGSNLKPRRWAPQAIEAGLIRSVKQMWRTLEKWVDDGQYEYGVTLDLGWPLPGWYWWGDEYRLQRPPTDCETCGGMLHPAHGYQAAPFVCCTCRAEEYKRRREQGAQQRADRDRLRRFAARLGL